jgi:hypothetical protein
MGSDIADRDPETDVLNILEQPESRGYFDDRNFDREINKEKYKTPLNKLARVESN